MGFDKLTEQTRAALGSGAAIREVKMFGGIGFMLNGNMVAAASERGLLVRVGKGGEAAALARPGTSVMEMRGRAMAGYVRLAPDSLDARAVKALVQMARNHVETLPAKKAKPAAKKKAAKKKAPN